MKITYEKLKPLINFLSFVLPVLGLIYSLGVVLVASFYDNSLQISYVTAIVGICFTISFEFTEWLRSFKKFSHIQPLKWAITPIFIFLVLLIIAVIVFVLTLDKITDTLPNIISNAGIICYICSYSIRCIIIQRRQIKEGVPESERII